MKRLAAIGETAEGLAGILITHEHSDHIAGLARLATKHKLPVYVTALTRDAFPPQLKLPAVEVIEAGKSFQIADLDIQPFTIPHDAVDPVAYRFTTEGMSVAVATDLGYLPENVKNYLRNCLCMVIESNHDLDMLKNGPYPWHVKQRVMARTGHLSNAALCDFLRHNYDGQAQVLVLAHLSEQNNHPQIAQAEATAALREVEAKHDLPLWAAGTRVTVSSQHSPTAVFQF